MKLDLVNGFLRAAGDAGTAEPFTIDLSNDVVLVPLANAVADQIKLNMLAGLAPDGSPCQPIADSTQRRAKKGANTRGVRSGRMVNSIHAEVSSGEAKIVVDEESPGQLARALGEEAWTADLGQDLISDAIDKIAGNVVP